MSENTFINYFKNSFLPILSIVIIIFDVWYIFTVYLNFPQFRFFRHGWRIVTGKYDQDDSKGETTPFQALTTAMSGAIGTGNIGGVALAIWTGGPQLFSGCGSLLFLE